MYPMSPLAIVRQLIYMHYIRVAGIQIPDGPLDINWKDWFGELDS